MVGRTSDVVASVQVPSTPAKSARTQAPKDSASNSPFGALVDSNTQAISNSSGQDPAPRRSDAAASTSDRSARDTAATDTPSRDTANDAADSASSGNDATADAADAGSKADAKPDGTSAGKTKDGSDTSDTAATDEPDADKTATDGLAAAVDGAAQADLAAQAALPDPNAAIVAPPVVPVDPAAAGSPTPDKAASPLAIAAAGLAASATTTAQIQGGKTDTATAPDKTAKTAGAKIESDTSATLADAATGTGDAAATEAKGNGGLTAVVDQGTPKTSFKAAVAAQGQSDVSNIGQDGDKAGTSGPQGPATANANPAHAQGAKPQTEAATADAKAGATERAGEAAPATPATHAHAQAPAAASADTGAQAAAAIQAPVTTTTSTASASTATLTATAATATAVPISGVPIELAAAARAGKTRFDISLDPVDLGRIDVRIHVDRNGQVTSHLTVEKPETLQLLRQDAPQLQRALDDAGLKTGSNGLSFSLRDQSSSGQNSGQGNDNGGNARRLIISEDDTIAAAPVGRGYGRMLGSSSGVDIRV